MEETKPQVTVDMTDYEHVDPVQLSVYGHRLMGIAEQMGDILRKISISINIKERLDYSCAIFSADGGLVANAPHVPVHLGAMSHAVRYQANLHGDTLQPGDVLLSNHPVAGGSHLPDLTVIMPAFHEGKIIFWTAARAHHADIGGIRPGSMPPFSKELWEEGAQFRSFKLVKAGHFDEEGVTKILSEEPAQYPGCSGTRTLSDVSQPVCNIDLPLTTEPVRPSRSGGSVPSRCGLDQRFGRRTVLRSGRLLHARHHGHC